MSDIQVDSISTSKHDKARSPRGDLDTGFNAFAFGTLLEVKNSTPTRSQKRNFLRLENSKSGSGDDLSRLTSNWSQARAVQGGEISVDVLDKQLEMSTSSHKKHMT
mmetsp:Transcript_12396/g.19358  ORF Transcript_12396/g.19358 Transcript_12396/m.19358 type:complete len:106 (+) Transcript_12396:310-627(+)